jgi:hypothetical protein
MAAFFMVNSNSRGWHASLHRLSARVLANGTSPYEMAHSEDAWSFLAANPAHSQLVNEAMASDARVAVPAIIHGCPEVFDGLGSLVDVGGGNGTTLHLHMLVQAFPWLRGINFDLPHAVSEALEFHSVEHVGGDMFGSVPKADATFLMVSPVSHRLKQNELNNLFIYTSLFCLNKSPL